MKLMIPEKAKFLAIVKPRIFKEDDFYCMNFVAGPEFYTWNNYNIFRIKL